METIWIFFVTTFALMVTILALYSASFRVQDEGIVLCTLAVIFLAGIILALALFPRNLALQMTPAWFTLIFLTAIFALVKFIAAQLPEPPIGDPSKLTRDADILSACLMHRLLFILLIASLGARLLEI